MAATGDDGKARLWLLDLVAGAAVLARARESLSTNAADGISIEGAAVLARARESGARCNRCG